MQKNTVFLNVYNKWVSRFLCGFRGFPNQSPQQKNPKLTPGEELLRRAASSRGPAGHGLPDWAWKPVPNLATLNPPSSGKPLTFLKYGFSPHPSPSPLGKIVSVIPGCRPGASGGPVRFLVAQQVRVAVVLLRPAALFALTSDTARQYTLDITSHGPSVRWAGPRARKRGTARRAKQGADWVSGRPEVPPAVRTGR